MSVVLKIFQTGKLVNSFNLEPGTYTIGRNNKNNIHLQDRSISSSHAQVVISTQQVTMIDCESLNGLYTNGERFSKKIFTKNFCVNIGTYQLFGEIPGSEPQTQKVQNNKNSEGKRSKSGLNIKLALPALSLFLFATILLSCILPLHQRIGEIQERVRNEQAQMLVEQLVNLNRDSIVHRQYKQIRLNIVAKQPGVRFVFLVDAFAKVVAPMEKQGKLIDWRSLIDVLEDGQNREWLFQDGSRVLCRPVKGQEEEIVGAVVLGINPQVIVGGSSTDVKILFLTITIILAFLIGSLVLLTLKLFLNPLRNLETEVEAALRNPELGLNFRAPYRELAALSTAIDRLLRRNPQPQSIDIVKPDMQAKPQSLIQDSNSESIETDIGKLQKTNRLWWIVDLESFIIIETSMELSDFFKFEDSFLVGQHILEGFSKNGALLNAISSLIEFKDSTEVEATVVENRPPYTVTKVILSANPSQAIFLLTGSTNG